MTHFEVQAIVSINVGSIHLSFIRPKESNKYPYITFEVDIDISTIGEAFSHLAIHKVYRIDSSMSVSQALKECRNFLTKELERLNVKLPDDHPIFIMQQSKLDNSMYIPKTWKDLDND